jgi:hypothetical protein
LRDSPDRQMTVSHLGPSSQLFWSLRQSPERRSPILWPERQPPDLDKRLQVAPEPLPASSFPFEWLLVLSLPSRGSKGRKCRPKATTQKRSLRPFSRLRPRFPESERRLPLKPSSPRLSPKRPTRESAERVEGTLESLPSSLPIDPLPPEPKPESEWTDPPPNSSVTDSPLPDRGPRPRAWKGASSIPTRRPSPKSEPRRILQTERRYPDRSRRQAPRSTSIP